MICSRRPSVDRFFAIEEVTATCLAQRHSVIPAEAAIQRLSKETLGPRLHGDDDLSMTKPHNKIRRQLLALLVAATLIMFASHAGAHAFLDHAAPAVGSTVHGSPPQLKLWFTQRLEPAFSTARVLDRSGKQVDTGDAKVDRAAAAARAGYVSRDVARPIGRHACHRGRL